MGGSIDKFPYLAGGFAEYGYVYPTGGAVRVPDGITDAVASAASCGLQTVVHAFESSPPVNEATVVIIQGAGPLGLFSVARYVAAGARVILIGGPAQRLELAKAWGATDVVNIEEVPSASDRIKLIKDLTHGRGGNIVVQASGMSAAFTEGVEMIANGGYYLIIGQGHDAPVIFDPSVLTSRNISIGGVRAAGAEHTWRAMEFLNRHKSTFNWDSMITSFQSLDHINEAFDRMRSWEEIKPAIQLLQTG
ncbi:hypothetical protein AU252_01020 [Pseudarthrobacter sulfonivorans]|uniref:Alcohol dehydrogenase-like C-terminal domain-containing protein n=2 Tax=Pseudarthrobacter sulfonivorans TaxID=121292 RepID=A0A0U3QSQ1_9MICC|nr:hypothetical protein AU252_01020 [Pseudarthrobacter sulfonivorans]